MSLIQQALEKGDGEEKKKKSTKKPLVATKTPAPRPLPTTRPSPKPIPTPIPEKVEEQKTAAKELPKFDPRISPAAPPPIIPKPEIKVKPRPYNKSRYFVVGFMLFIFTIALAACYFLALEMSYSWQGRNQIAERETKLTEVQAPAPIVDSAPSTQTLQRTPSVVPPTVKAMTSTRELPYKLSGITSTGGQKFALINNKILQAGDRIDDFSTLLRIGSKQVMVDFQGQEVTLEL